MHKYILNTLLLLFSTSLLYACGAASSSSASNVSTPVSVTACSQSAIETAITEASDGDTITVAAGNCTWTSTITVTDKSLNFEGAGIDSTVITCASGFNCISIDNNSGKPFSITGFTFDGVNAETWGIIKVIGTDDNWRIYNNKFANIAKRGITVANNNDNDSSYGVIDNNTFLAPYNLTAQAVTILGDNSAWSRAYTPGTANAVYVENNTFNFTFKNDTALDSYNGARIVIRYNDFIGTELSNHGLDSGPDYRSPHTYEVYNNTFTTTNSIAFGIRFRGSTGVVYNNTFTGTFGSPLSVTNYRSCASFTNWGQCDGGNSYDGNEAFNNTTAVGTHTGIANQAILTDSAETWTVNEWVDLYVYNTTDGSKCQITANSANTVTCTLTGGTDNDWDTGDSYKFTNGYPCMDTVGRTTGQISEPMYEWSNLANGSDTDNFANDHCSSNLVSVADHLKEGTEFINDTIKPGYTAYTYPHPLNTTTP